MVEKASTLPFAEFEADTVGEDIWHHCPVMFFVVFTPGRDLSWAGAIHSASE